MRRKKGLASNKTKFDIIYGISFPLLFIALILFDLPAYVVAASVLFFMLTLKRHEAAAVLMLAFPHILGTVGSFVGFGIPATVILFLITLAILNTDVLQMFNRSVGTTLIYTILVLFVIAFCYLASSPSSSGASKLSSTVQMALGAGVGFSILLTYKDIDFSKVAASFLLVALLYLWIAYDLLFFPKPESIIDFSSFRDYSMMLKHTDLESLSYHRFGYCGLFFMVYYFAEGKSIKSLFSIILVVLSTWICLYSGARQTIIGLALLFMLMWMLNNNRVSFKTLLWGGVAVLVFALILSNLTVFQDFTDSGASAEQRLNRSYDYPIEMFSANPITGVGYGNYEDPTGEVYAHNIFLEVLSEMGLLGLLGLSSVVIIFFMTTSSKRSHYQFDKFRGLLVILPYVIRSLISGGLHTNIQVFVVIFAAMASMGFAKEIQRR